ncbi:MAG: hypothetical protein HYU88_06570 [Chloroflexi bacterium]|nr:hypothetical protein [Chloroflexota bacterium]
MRELVCPPALAEALAAATEELHGELAKAGVFAPLAPLVAGALGASDTWAARRGADVRADAVALLLFRELGEASHRRLGEVLQARGMPLDVAADGSAAPMLETLEARARPLVRFWAEELPERDLVVEQHLVGLADRELERDIAALEWARATLVATGNPLEACWMRTLHGLTAVDTVAAAIGREQWLNLSAQERHGLALCPDPEEEAGG